MSGEQEKHAVLKLAGRAGKVLLESGAEIARVEETIDRICAHYGIAGESAFVLSNGIFFTADGTGGCYAKVEHVPIHQTRLDRVAAACQLSREIERGCRTTAEAEQALDAIESLPQLPWGWQSAAAGIGSGAFCLLFGGGPWEGLFSGLAGLVCWLFLVFIGGPKCSKVTGIIASSFTGSCVCCLFHWLCGRTGMEISLDSMIMGAILPLVPGVPFTVAIRDIVNSDYLSGYVRMMDALLVFFCAAGGAVLALSAYQQLGGAPL